MTKCFKNSAKGSINNILLYHSKLAVAYLHYGFEIEVKCFLTGPQSRWSFPHTWAIKMSGRKTRSVPPINQKRSPAPPLLRRNFSWRFRPRASKQRGVAAPERGIIPGAGQRNKGAAGFGREDKNIIKWRWENAAVSGTQSGLWNLVGNFSFISSNGFQFFSGGAGGLTPGLRDKSTGADGVGGWRGIFVPDSGSLLTF